MSRISVRGIAVASATAVTAVGSVVGVASGSSAQNNNDAEATAADATLLADLPAGQQARVQTASLTQQADTVAAQADASARKDAEQAARAAAAKAAEAKKSAAEKRAAAKAAAGDPTAGFQVQSSYTVAQIKAMAAQIVGSGQFQCFSNIVDHESTWNYLAVNPSSGAYGLVQALPGNKMASVAADWQSNPATQIKWGLNYMNTTYGSPCQAWAFWQVHHAY
ncbi:MAG: lytic transglycosylase domain-containing protein [Streptomyces sp.]|uniref:aggregation-promoting factor C-terminal-like domain-containing protein n=1 Tax=Streptomyces sp. TaxID=1931 RepID=UPI0025E22648|nr:lytic transglycosylase domain-containing protein [Streptomyces sp.]MBW8800101.1 lytic transglycosylase domain-containing protein [Streptomyces sp.]